MSNADTVNEWFRERLAAGPLARSTEAYNQLVEALPVLIARLDGSDGDQANAVRDAPKLAKAPKVPPAADPAPVDPPAGAPAA